MITLLDTIAPVVTDFIIPANVASLTVPVTMLVATDSVGVDNYMLSETSSQPQANDSAWSVGKPVSYTFLSQGVKTLYAFAKDAAGNISAPLSATVMITLPDTTAPVVSSFAIPASTANLTVPVSIFTATDDAGVTGYYLSETSSVPQLSDSHWTTMPTSYYIFTSAGAKTLYAFAKDAAGNISLPLFEAVMISLADMTAPTVNVFTMPTTAINLTVPITAFAASDNTAVTGYILSESGTVPPANMSGWISTPSNAYTFSSAGNRTLYAFAKDAAGNISLPVAATLTITLTDSATPTITTFILPASSSSLTVPVTAFAATDNVAVTGYLVAEESTPPLQSAQTWTSTAPGSHTFNTGGGKVLYGFAKDAAGNISPPASASVVITLPAIQGVCGSSNNGTFTIFPATNLCTTGTASTVVGTGPWSWTCDGTNGGATASCSANVSVTSPTQYTVTPTTGSGYSITPATVRIINQNSTTTFSIIPANGYGIASATGCSGSLSGTTFTTGAIAANCAVVVTAVARTASTNGGAPTISNALMVLQAVTGTTSLSATDRIRYDVAPFAANGTPLGNGVIDAADVIAILRRTIGIGSW